MKKPALLLLSCLTVSGLCVELENNGIYQQFLYEEPVKDMRVLFTVSPVMGLILLISLYIVYKALSGYIEDGGFTKRDKLLCIIPAALFALFMLIGRSFSNYDSAELFTGSALQIAKAALYVAGLWVLFYFFIAALFALIKKSRFTCPDLDDAGGLWGRYVSALYRRPFLTAFISLLIIYIPLLIISYPSILYGDTYDVVGQAFNVHERTSAYLNLIDENVRLNNHHPIIFTVFENLCLKLGKLVFGSYNAGMFLLNCIQVLCSASVFSLCIRLLTKLRARPWMPLALLLFFAFSPLVQNYLVVNTKDVLYGCYFVLFYAVFFSLVCDKGLFRHESALLIILSLLVCLQRNDGKYIVLICCAAALLKKGRLRKLAPLTALSVLALMLLYSSVLLPALHITPGSRREALSLPFQQTARVLRECPEEVSAEEREIIGRVLDVDSIAERYYPRKADRVKNTFNEDATSGELGEYLRLWFRMFFRFPRVYADAFLNNYFNYFYPGKTLAETVTYGSSERTCQSLELYTEFPDLGISFSHPDSLYNIRHLYEDAREYIFALPILSLFKSSAPILWSLILLFFLLIMRREWALLLSAAPLYATALTWFAGPCNGDYFRYQYCVAVCLPAALLLSLCSMKSAGGGDTDGQNPAACT